VAGAAVMRPSHRAARVTAAPAVAPRSPLREIRNSTSPVQTKAQARSYRVVQWRMGVR